MYTMHKFCFLQYMYSYVRMCASPAAIIIAPNLYYTLTLHSFSYIQYRYMYIILTMMIWTMIVVIKN